MKTLSDVRQKKLKQDLLTNMAIDFLIDGAKNFGQIASDSAKNIFNDVTKNNSLLNKCVCIIYNIFLINKNYFL